MMSNEERVRECSCGPVVRTARQARIETLRTRVELGGRSSARAQQELDELLNDDYPDTGVAENGF